MDKKAVRRTVSMRLDPEIYKNIKRLALENDCSISDIVENALKAVLVKDQKEQERSK